MSYQDNVNIAVELIKGGGLVAFATETVYGLGADATNQEACKKIYDLKSRPNSNPLIIHVDSLETAKKYGIFEGDAELLAEKLWPAPLTIVVPRLPDSGLADAITSGLPTVAIRVPAHKEALDFIRKTGKPIAAPSCNPSGYISATTEADVFGHFPDLYRLKSDIKPYGLESTIINFSGGEPTILRYGFITPNTISSILRKEVLSNINGKVQAPGMLQKHYSPNAMVRINATATEGKEHGLGFGEMNLGALNLSHDSNLEEAAANLYPMLRKLDNFYKATKIAVAPIPNTGIGLAINDRIHRAAQ